MGTDLLRYGIIMGTDLLRYGIIMGIGLMSSPRPINV